MYLEALNLFNRHGLAWKLKRNLSTCLRIILYLWCSDKTYQWLCSGWNLQQSSKFPSCFHFWGLAKWAILTTSERSCTTLADLKRMTNTIMNKKGSPLHTWILAVMNFCYVCNCTTSSLNNWTYLEVLTDIPLSLVHYFASLCGPWV